MEALIDGDILRYEVSFAAEKIADGDAPFSLVETVLLKRIDEICKEAGADKYTLFLTGDTNFRNDIAVTKKYKGNRKSSKPFHWKNISVYMKTFLKCVERDGLEADDLMAIYQTDNTIICSRDKDLRQIPGWQYSWEVGGQPSFGPELITDRGYIELSSDRKKLTGTGKVFFYAQCLMGDPVDNIPGLPGIGSASTFDIICFSGEPVLRNLHDIEGIVANKYKQLLGVGWEKYFIEQARLLWIVRELDEQGEPVMWRMNDEKS